MNILPTRHRPTRPRSTTRNPARAPRRVGARSLLPYAFAAMAGPHCVGDDQRTPFTSEQDAAVIASIEGAWAAQGPEGPISLTLCESPFSFAEGRYVCGVARTVRGKGRGQTEEIDLDPSRGCAELDCDARVQAYFVGSLRLPDGQARELKGLLKLSVRENTSAPYELPYTLTLSATPLPEAGEADVSIELVATHKQADVLDDASVTFERGDMPYERYLDGYAVAEAAGQAGAAGAGAGAAGQAGVADAAGAGAGGAGQAGAAAGGAGQAGAAAGGAAGAGNGGGEGAETAGGGGVGAPLPEPGEEFRGEIAWGGLTFRRVGPGDCSTP